MNDLFLHDSLDTSPVVEYARKYAASLPANSRSPASIKGQSSQKTF